SRAAPPQRALRARCACACKRSLLVRGEATAPPRRGGGYRACRAGGRLAVGRHRSFSRSKPSGAWYKGALRDGDPHLGLERQLSAANELIDIGRYDAARPILEGLAAREPDSPRVARLLAVVLLELGELRPALDQAQRAVRLDPDAS